MTPLGADLLTAVLFDAAFIAFALVGARRAGLVGVLTPPNAITILILGFGAQCLFALFCSDRTIVLTFIASMAAVTVCAATDASTGYVLDAVTLPGLLTLIAIAASSGRLPSACEGLLSAGGAMLALHAMTLGRGLGLGDVKLACCIGAGAGVLNALLALGAAFVFGGVYAAYVLVMRRGSRGDEMRFAPYMAAAMAAVSFYRMPV